MGEGNLSRPLLYFVLVTSNIGEILPFRFPSFRAARVVKEELLQYRKILPVFDVVELARLIDESTRSYFPIDLWMVREKESAYQVSCRIAQ
jgi:hypothetical protein